MELGGYCLTESCPILLEVSTHRRLIEGGPGLVDLRLTNVSQAGDAYVRVGLSGELIDAWAAPLEVIPAGGHVVVRVRTAGMPRGTYLVAVRLSVEASDGLMSTLVGHFDRDVESAGVTGPSYHLSITGGDGSVIDAEHLRVGADAYPLPEKRAATYEQVLLRADPLTSALKSCILTDSAGTRRLHVLTGSVLAIGRDRDNVNLPVNERYNQVSRLHCRLTADEHGVWLDHVATTNTTRLNDTEVPRRVSVPVSESSRVLLARQCEIEVTPLTHVAIEQGMRRHLADRGVALPQPLTPGLGGILIRMMDENVNRSELYLWVLGTVRLCDIPDAPQAWAPLALASIPELFGMELSPEGAILTATGVIEGNRLGRCVVSCPE